MGISERSESKDIGTFIFTLSSIVLANLSIAIYLLLYYLLANDPKQGSGSDLSVTLLGFAHSHR